MVPILKMKPSSCLSRQSLPPEVDKIAQTFISEIGWLSVLKYRATGMSTSFVLTEQSCYKQICQKDVDWFHRCKVYYIYCNICSKLFAKLYVSQ